ncbi:CsbD family protein [Amycolatopsis magusensis]|uniref:CsbD family protein n=1 Tax=Amycolatopsis magusensis TaxID=882444 RepID=UPI0037BB8830
MSLVDKAKDKAQQAMGAAKEKLGHTTGNEDLKDSGKADQTKGEVKETGHDLRDKAAGAVQDLKGKRPEDR